MSPELEAKLIKKYGKICSFYRQDIRQPFYFGFECGDGWYSLVDSLLHNLLKLSESENLDLQIHQVKNKFGALRTYTSCRNDNVNYYTSRVETASEFICEDCGTSRGVTIPSRNYIRPLCRECLAASEKIVK